MRVCAPTPQRTDYEPGWGAVWSSHTDSPEDEVHTTLLATVAEYTVAGLVEVVAWPWSATEPEHVTERLFINSTDRDAFQEALQVRHPASPPPSHEHSHPPYDQCQLIGLRLRGGCAAVPQRDQSRRVEHQPSRHRRQHLHRSTQRGSVPLRVPAGGVHGRLCALGFAGGLAARLRHR